MPFPTRLASLRKQHQLTQRALADLVDLSVIQIRRYEAGSSQPTLEALRKLAVALHVSADVLLFEADERGADPDLRLQFEAVSRFDAEEKQVTRAVLDGLILKHEAKRLAAASATPPTHRPSSMRESLRRSDLTARRRRQAAAAR